MNFVTPTTVLRFLNRNLGKLVQTLELTSEEMMRVVFQESLNTYSKFFPYLYKINIGRKDLIDPNYDNIYRIPNPENMTIIGVSRIWRGNMNQYGGSILPLTNDPFESQMMNDFMSMHVTPSTLEFTPPNILTVKPRILYDDDILVEIKTVHPTHLHTIPMSMRDEFLNLCLYDVLISLYPLRHRFGSINTPYGNLELFLEMIDSAEQKKEELLTKWRENVHKQGNRKKIWTA